MPKLSSRARPGVLLIGRLWLWCAVCCVWLAGSSSAAAFAASDEDRRIERFAERAFGAGSQVREWVGDPPAAPVAVDGELSGYLIRSFSVTRIPAYSGEPIDVLLAVSLDGVVRELEILHHSEPILMAGVSEADLARYAAQYRGMAASQEVKIGGVEREGVKTVDGLSGATITAMVLNATISRTARALATSRGLVHSGDPSRAALAPNATDSAGALWVTVWQERRFRIAVLALGLFTLATILVFQDWLTRHPTLLRRIRLGFLIYSLTFIGWYGLAQLSVINVLTFSHAMMGRFDWATFLIDPMMFILWSFVALTVLLWGRGVYCGWLCAFGALQELVNKLARRLGVPQWNLPSVVHERLLALKYLLLVSLFGLSLHSMVEAIRYSEVEPFKTAINLRFAREWEFVLYAVALIAVSAVNGKFFCKYLCPLGAALSFPARFAIFSWLRRRKECGRPCQTCARECPSQAIRPTGEIDVVECHYCLDCQVTYWDQHKCPPLVEKRKRQRRAGR